MIRRYKKYCTIFFSILIVFSYSVAFAQSNTLEQYNDLINKSKQFRKNNMADSSVKLLLEVKQIAKQLNDPQKIAKSHLLLADAYYWGVSDFYRCRKELDTVKEKYFNILTTSEKCACLSQYADAIYYDGEFVRSVEYYYKALEYVGKDSVMLARLYHNIGWVYTDLKKFDKGIDFGLKSLEVAKKSKGDVQHKLEGLVYIYKTAGEYKKALEYQDQLAILDTSLNQLAYNNYQKMAIYSQMKSYDSSVVYGEKALVVSKKINHLRLQMMILNELLSDCILDDRMDLFTTHLAEYEILIQKFDKPYDVDLTYALAGEYYLEKQQYDKAKFYLDKAKELQEKYKRPDIENTYKLISQWYSENKDYKNAHLYLEKYTTISDSLHLLERYDASKSIDDYQKIYEMENTLGAKQIELENKNLLVEKEKGQKKLFLIGLCGVLAIAILFLVNIFNRRRTNKLLASQNNVIEIKNEMLSTKNKEIIDSINYAKKLQDAILPTTNEIARILSESFVLFKPKDIVAGDFYWLAETNNYIFYATVDCTGHGVPGGFMCMLGHSFLNEIILEKKIHEPADILDLLRIKIISSLKQTGMSGENKDGMDMILCRINKTKTELTYAAANNSLWLVRNNVLTEFKGNKQPVGISAGLSQQFDQHSIALNQGDCIYTSTDGYADQFGGPKGKKFKYKQLEETLVTNNSKRFEEQKNILEKTIEDWKGNLEQVDDILIIGIRI